MPEFSQTRLDYPEGCSSSWPGGSWAEGLCPPSVTREEHGGHAEAKYVYEKPWTSKFAHDAQSEHQWVGHNVRTACTLPPPASPSCSQAASPPQQAHLVQYLLHLYKQTVSHIPGAVGVQWLKVFLGVFKGVLFYFRCIFHYFSMASG